MSSRLKTILLIVGLLTATAFIGYGLYYMFGKSGEALQPTTPTEISQPSQTLPGSEERQPGTSAQITQPTAQLPSAGVIQGQTASYYQAPAETKLTDSYSDYGSLNSKNGSVRYYDNADGKFYRVTSDGQIKEMDEQIFFNVDNVTWAKNSDKAVLEYPDGSKIIYDFENGKQYSLPKHWEDFSFSPDDQQIAAKSIGLSPENRWLVAVNSDGTGSQIIEPLGENEDYVTVNWSPNRQVVAFSRTGEDLGLEREEILLIGLNGENFKALTVEGSGFEPQWSPDGQQLLYSVYNSDSDYKPQLWVTTAYGNSIDNNRRLLNINTWPDKCAFGDKNTIYCAVPQTMPQGAGLSRDIALYATDDLYKIDLSTGLKTPIKLEGEHSINNINYDDVNNRLIFSDSRETGIFEVEL